MSKPISPNTTIAQYSIISKIDEGGMGEVWRARDTKLGREVAIKVLPAAFSSDKDRLLRFEQEAQATSALNHPNIIVIFHTQDPTNLSNGRCPPTGPLKSSRFYFAISMTERPAE